MNYSYKTMNSPVGCLKLIADTTSLVAVLWENDDPGRVNIEKIIEAKRQKILLESEKQLNEYFAGCRTQFSLPINFVGTEFQKKVWKALTTIPFGETLCYSQLADKIDHHKAARAVGAANKKNPISIIVPCHRVIGANGKLTGFAGGLEVKAQLLEFEKGSRHPTQVFDLV